MTEIDPKIVVLAGLRVTEEIRTEALKNWPRRTPTGYDDRTFSAACANHVLLVAREHGWEPIPDQLYRGEVGR